MGLAMSIVESVEKSLSGRRVKEVKEIEIELGELNSITPKQMRQVFRMASSDTIADGAKLKIKLVKGKVKCLNCGYTGGIEVELEHDHSAHIHCPKCQGVSVEILKGKDIEIKSIKAEVDE